MVIEKNTIKIKSKKKKKIKKKKQNIMVESTDFGDRMPGLETYLHNFLSV